ncbi:MAG: hypothetical protein A2104_08305 [Candidatus Melainabacteria bacterium GWF2_32_7]|nr:MAG: hypothetical protein A2104_08305 [Candidatus Melainabacteria bacterium GWF2_32_7]
MPIRQIKSSTFPISHQRQTQHRLDKIRELTNQGRHVEASDLFNRSIAQVPAPKPSKLGIALKEMVQSLKRRTR